ncbi:regulator of chromosome condensation 1/beta-lactamase-inhibitor protein II [Mycena epipterygia]|nr:regulator of chromosome condensation 1/beta-lactamase-inhibitor protein II [Mycena epipterygia]
MFKPSWRPHVRRLHRATSGQYKTSLPLRSGLLASSALFASALWYTLHVVHNDGPVPFVPAPNKPQWPASGPSDQNKSDTLNTLVWGSNRASILSTLLPASITIKKPFAVGWLNDVALRDLALHERHAACVDARGDVYQWGEGYAARAIDDDGRPTRTLSGKDIVKLQLSDRRVFALSKSGNVYVLDSSASNQTLAEPYAPAWWKFWATPQLVDFAELAPQNHLARGEKFVSISAGRDHLLALTSTGRTFASPVTKNANACGQLGFDAPNLSSPADTPKSLASASYTAATALSPPPPATNTQDADIRFCTTLYEIPILKGVDIAQVATGTHSSFARTPDGKVLAWGANEHGQLGLGARFPSDFVKIPTEVVLWPTKAQQASTRCLSVSAGGDLTGFTIERTPPSEAATVELLMCGDGQLGGLGNNLYSNAQVSPVRVKTLSGLVEFDEATMGLRPIPPQAIAISQTGHVLATLDPCSGGRDLQAWGRNQDYELGNGKKSNVPVPAPVDASNGRVLLQTKKANEVRDLQGRVWGRGRAVSQSAVCGFGSSTIYWRLVL